MELKEEEVWTELEERERERWESWGRAKVQIASRRESVDENIINNKIQRGAVVPNWLCKCRPKMAP